MDICRLMRSLHQCIALRGGETALMFLTEGQSMVLVRDVFHCKFGHVGEVVSFFKTLFEPGTGNTNRGIGSARILTDISGRYYTVVVEIEVESVDAHQKLLHATFASGDFADGFARLTELVESGHREYYNIE